MSAAPRNPGGRKPGDGTLPPGEKRSAHVRVFLRPDELARLDELRGTTSRSEYLRRGRLPG